MTHDEQFKRAFIRDAPELPECLHRLHRAHVAGLVWRETCPACHGDGCSVCDQTGMVEELLSPERLAAMLRDVGRKEALLRIGRAAVNHGR